MRRTLLALLASFPVLTCAGLQLPEGRWEGIVDIPDRPLAVVVDLATDRGGAWLGSLVVPGLGIKGAPLSNLSIDGAAIAFDIAALGGAKIPAASVKVRLVEPDRLAGELTQGGNVARLALRRTASPQVDLAPRSTPVRTEALGEWSGEYELGGYPRRVTLRLRNQAGAGAAAELVIVGKQTTKVPVDLVIEDGEFVRVESQVYRIVFEGRVVGSRREIAGTIELGGATLPLVLSRAPREPS